MPVRGHRVGPIPFPSPTWNTELCPWAVLEVSVPGRGALSHLQASPPAHPPSTLCGPGSHPQYWPGPSRTDHLQLPATQGEVRKPKRHEDDSPKVSSPLEDCRPASLIDTQMDPGNHVTGTLLGRWEGDLIASKEWQGERKGRKCQQYPEAQCPSSTIYLPGSSSLPSGSSLSRGTDPQVNKW